MDPCYVVIAGICLSPMNLESASYQFRYSAEASVKFRGFELNIFDSDNVVDMDAGRSSRACQGGHCVVYHQYCDTPESRERCAYHIQRDGRIESLSIIATADGGALPADWREQISLQLGRSGRTRMALARLTAISAERDWPRVPPRRLSQPR